MIPGHVWPGNFPKKDTYVRAGIKGEGSTQEGGDGFGWVQGGALAPSKHKTRQTDTQIAPQVIILARVWVGKLANKDDEVGT